jgi:hypothetical protein
MTIRRALLVLIILVACLGAAAPASADHPLPPEPCVPGTVWTDTQSGIKYLCIYVEAFGGGKWFLLGADDDSVADSQGFTFQNTINGCAHNTVAATSDYLGAPTNGFGSVLRSFVWPCVDVTDKSFQPAGEQRGRDVIQKWNGAAWVTVQDTGYVYSDVTAWTWVVGKNHGSAPDYGTGTYRNIGFGSFFQGGAWRGTSRTTPSIFMQ